MFWNRGLPSYAPRLTLNSQIQLLVLYSLQSNKTSDTYYTTNEILWCNENRIKTTHDTRFQKSQGNQTQRSDCTVDNSIYTKESKPSKLVTVLETSCSWLHVLSVGVGWDWGWRRCSINSFTKMKINVHLVNSSKEIMDRKAEGVFKFVNIH